LTLAVDENNKWDLATRRKIAKWLSVDKFCPFFTYEFDSKIYYLTYTGGVDIMTNGLDHEGYIQAQFTNISPYSYSFPVDKTYDFSAIGSGTGEFTMILDTDNNVLPKIWIYKIGQGDVTITNTSNNNSVF